MPFKLVLNDDGSCKVQDGWPLVHSDDGADPVPLDLDKLAGKLKTANGEAQKRRESLEALDGFKAAASEHLEDFEFSQVPALVSELKELREAKKAGDLGEDAAEEIRRRSAAAAQEQIQQSQEQAKKANVAKAAAEKAAAEARQELEQVRIDSAMAEFHASCDRFAPGTLEGFKLIAKAQQDGGFRWRWGEKGPVLRTDEGTVKEDSNSLEPLGLEPWRKSLESTHPYLFKNISGAGSNGNGAPAGTTDWSKLTDAQKNARFNEHVNG